MSQKKFDLLTALYANVQFATNWREGTLAIPDEATLATLRAVAADQDEYGVFLPDDNASAAKVGDTVTVELSTPRTGIGAFPASFADLIRKPSARVAEPERYYLVSERYNRCDDVSVPEIVKRYRTLLAFVKLLGDAAAYTDHAAGQLVYFHEGKFEVPVHYSAAEVVSLDIGVVDTLLQTVGSDTHRDQKLAILAEAVRELTRSVPSAQRFKTLLSHLPELVRKFNDGYRLFASSFSYEKVKSELESARVEYAAKIHKVFTDIQNQILGIPVATIVVATQMKTTKAVDATFFINFGVLLGAWVFVVLSTLLLINQNHTLDVLEGEIERQRSELTKLHKEIATDFSGVFKFLNGRLKTQRRWLNVVLAILLGGGGLATVMFFLVTDPARAALARAFGG